MRYSTLGSIFSSSALYFRACSVDVTGGLRLGCKGMNHWFGQLGYDLRRTMTYARSKPPLRTWGTMRLEISPCRRWTWKSAGAETVMDMVQATGLVCPKFDLICLAFSERKEIR